MQKKYLVMLIQTALLSGLPVVSTSAAQCTPASGNVSCTGTGMVAGNIGNGRNTSNTTITVEAGVVLDGGNAPAISLNDSNTITVNGTVQNSAPSSSSGLLNAGANTIEVISNSNITIEQGGKVLANGTSGNAEAINVMGFGNTITNRGTIQSSGSSAALWFEDDEGRYGPPTAKNRVENFGVIARGTAQTSTASVFGTSSRSGGAGIVFVNHTNSKVIGSLAFGQGDDDLEFYSNSLVTGNINGGGGVNRLTLNGSTHSRDTLRGDISNFTTLDKNGEGRWDVTGALNGFTVVSVNQGTLGLSGDNTRYTGQLVINPEGNNDPTATVEAPARSLPVRPGNNTNNVVNNGILRLTQDKNETYVGQITGSGQLIKTGQGTLTLNPQAPDGNLWRGGTTIQQGAIALSKDNQLGAANSALTLDGGGLIFNNPVDLAASRSLTVTGNNGFIDTQANSTNVAQAINGTGTLSKRGSGMLNITGQNRDRWSANVEQGILNVDGAMAGNVTVQSGALLTGSGSVGNTTLNTGSTLIVGSSAAPSAAGPHQFTVNGAIQNNGTLQLYRENDSTLTNRLQINGDYHGGDGSLLKMNTLLAGDHAPSDLLAITGSTSGKTGVSISNVGGHGEQALNGIKVIDVKGNSSSQAFFQQERIAAGAYDYFLTQKGKNWYLTNHVEGVDAEDPDTPDALSDPEDTPEFTGKKAYRPEIGGYLANLQAANTLFTLTLDDREGGTEYLDPVSGEIKKTSMWLRQEGGHNRFSAAEGQVKTQANRYVVQLGGEIANGSFSETDRWDVGVMAGYANQQANSHSTLTGYRARSKIDGYSAGAYATWFEQAQAKTGWYVDSWALYNWFDNSLSSPEQPGESWKSRGVTASLETGHISQLAQYQRTSLYLQPQAQAVWMGVKNAHDLTEANGTKVQDVNNGNIQTRLGVRLYLKGHSALDDGKSREFKPYVEANWLHNTERYGVRMDGETVSVDGARNIAQLKLGVQGQITPSLNIWGGTAVQIGDNSYSDASAMLGVKYRF
ncbi:autotransporter outer membrane beta-barrel domain-containing protein [Pluralibacter sp.]|uniref:autotransporter outer membrane beta-barrel domain-containing protein n=1 Tax=Pluralibacter sp. TaxID=1920032 RepID=UPI0025E4454D|nr:autotransporter outer membrane beta-barrel domain-containing protein [Pluralibacter sp.]MBV8042604.1 autotransporter outer membrane beta-barrel domain-containing protein [Pluralibacter sp.]